MNKFVLTTGLTNIATLIATLHKLDPTQKWTVSWKLWKSQRSIDQNRWVRKYARDASSHFGYSPDDMYDILMYKHNPKFITDLETGEVIRTSGHFSALDTSKAADVQEMILSWGAELGFYWEDL